MSPTPHEFYAAPGRHTDITLAGVDVAEISRIVEVVRGILVYDTVAKEFAGSI